MGVAVKAIRIVRGRAAPLMRSNVDTDQIIPKRFLKRVERSGYGEMLFRDWAFDEEDRPRPDFVLNRPEYAGAVILVTGPNFGSGSSREHAPWALQDWGFDAVVAPSFADIFRQNSHKNGLLPVVLAEDAVERIAAAVTADPGAEVVIDLEAQTVHAPGVSASFEIDSFVRNALLEGIDDIDRTLEWDGAIAAYERERPSYLPKAPTR